MIKRILGLLLVCTLCMCVFTACGDSKEKTETTEETTESVSYENLDLSTDDLFYAITGIPGETVLFTVDGQDVTASMYFYWLSYDLNYANYYSEYYGDETFDLSTDADSYKDEAKMMASQYPLIGYKAHEMGYALSDEQKEEIDIEMEDTMAQYGGEEEFCEMLRQSGINESIYRSFIEAEYYADIIEEKEFEGRPTHEDIETYAEDNDLMYMKHILVMTCDENYEPLSDEEKTEKYDLAVSLLDQIRNSDDPEEKFNELMNEYSEDTGLTSYPDGYLFTSGEMVEPVENAVRDLEFGEISDIIEYDGAEDGGYSGYHIILRLDPADYDGIDQYWLDDELSNMIQSWIDDADYEYSEYWDNIDVETFYDLYSEYQEAFYEQERAESEIEDEEELEYAEEDTITTGEG